jgi:3-isopropylmalate/(R)-2-methylmalate dehydratase large subunit
MGMTATEKILARASGRDVVRPGDIVYPDPDVIMIHDALVLPSKRELDELGIDRLYDPDRVVMVTDHEVLYTSRRAAKIGATVRQAAKAWGVKQFYDVGQGGHGHIFLDERGIILPGMFVFDNDRRSTNHGSIGACALRVGAEITRVLATGTVWTMVPKTIRMTITGKLRPGTYARDVGFRMASGLKKGGFYGVDIDYRVLELAGPGLDDLNWDQRVALCSSPTEVGAVGVFIPPSKEMLAQIKRVAKRPFTPVYSDEDAAFDAEVAIDLDGLGPQVALTGSAGNGVDLSQVEGTSIDHAFIGSCASGKWEDLVIAAKVLKGNRVAPGVRLFIVPGSEDSNRRLTREGLLEIFQEAGAVMIPPGCGPCNAGNTGTVDTGEVSISTASANQLGVMGEEGSELFLASPATVAASAVAGRVTDPRTVDALMNDSLGDDL